MSYVLIQTRKTEHVGYVWFSPVVQPTVWELHTCAKPGLEGNWLSRKFVRECYRVLEDANAETCIAFHWGKNFETMLNKLGFEVGDAVSVLKIKEQENGKSFRRREQGSAATPARS